MYIVIYDVRYKLESSISVVFAVTVSSARTSCIGTES